MLHTTDTFNINLLRDNKNEFVLECQRIIEIIVKHYIKSGMFTRDQLRDVTQSVNEELIKRLPLIEKNFDNSVLMITYVNVVIRNICLRIHEREQSDITVIPLTNEYLLQKNEEHFTALFIQDEIDRLTLIFRLYGSQKHKITFCLKVYFGLPITLEDIHDCFTNINNVDSALLMDRFGGNYEHLLESDNFNILAPLMNRQEVNSTSGNSLRRWTQEHLSKIIQLLNGKPPSRTHTKETLKLLLEHYSLKHTS